MQAKVTLFWFRRDLRLEDNHALHKALESPFPVLPIFIFDEDITAKLPQSDPRITFIYDTLQDLKNRLNQHATTIYCKCGKPLEVWKNLVQEFEIQAVYANEDYEPYAIQRDSNIRQFLLEYNIPFYLFKDQVIFAKDEILKADNTPYTIYTPYKNKWFQKFKNHEVANYKTDNWQKYWRGKFEFPSLGDLNFKRSTLKIRPFDLNKVSNYEQNRDIPALNGTSSLSPHLRFGTVSIRRIFLKTQTVPAFSNELVWREFFMQILYHFPKVVKNNFKSKYDALRWQNNSAEFERWCSGETGYPIVDAGMRELNMTGYMNNRVRMIVASFLCKHLLIDWRWGEAYFAKKLLDYELSSNNGNWQWAAGTGCDAAPYFRVFNPYEQTRKFDPKSVYIKKWVTDLNIFEYPKPIVEHKFARQRAIQTYKESLQSNR